MAVECNAVGERSRWRTPPVASTTGTYTEPLCSADDAAGMHAVASSPGARTRTSCGLREKGAFPGGEGRRSSVWRLSGKHRVERERERRQLAIWRCIMLYICYIICTTYDVRSAAARQYNSNRNSKISSRLLNIINTSKSKVTQRATPRVHECTTNAACARDTDNSNVRCWQRCMPYV
jgi:hypothetical protein